MTPRAVAHASGDLHSALASATRRRLLELLRLAGSPRDAHDLANAVGLHVTTVRFHLDVLRRAGLVTRGADPPQGAGRPRTTYRLTDNPPHEDGGTAYEGLAALLAAHLENTPEQRAARAEQVGLAWAEQLAPPAESHPGLGTPSLDHAADEVSALFVEVGFDPEVTASEPQERRILLHACPFRALAREHPEVVCSIHLGMLRGTLSRLGSAAASRLVPFVEPELCVAYLSSA